MTTPAPLSGFITACQEALAAIESAEGHAERRLAEAQLAAVLQRLAGQPKAMPDPGDDWQRKAAGDGLD